MPEAVEARFFVAGYERRAYDPEATEVTLVAVSRGEHNKTWARATPSDIPESTYSPSHHDAVSFTTPLNDPTRHARFVYESR